MTDTLYTVWRKVCGPSHVIVARHLTYEQASKLVAYHGHRAYVVPEQDN